jgi:hypothetical protein
VEKRNIVEIEDGDILTEYFDNKPIAQYIVLDTQQYVLKLYILWIQEEDACYQKKWQYYHLW